MKILVTGATGFIGNHLIRELLKNKSNQVVATSRSANKAKKFDWFPKVKYIEYDVNNNTSEDLYSFFGKPDQLIHLAWDSLSNYNDLSHIETILFNHCRFVKSMVLGGLRDLVIAGTCFEYGMVDGCLSENMDTKPSNSYAIAKDTLRKFVVELEKQNRFVYKWIRLFYMYGEGQSKTSLMYLLDKAIQDKDKEFNMSSGEQLRDFLHIDKVVKNIDLIARQNIYLNQSINCCSGKPVSIKNLVESYLEKKKHNMKLNLGFYPYPDYEPMEFWGDNCKLQKIKKGN
jgi:dTDP-6-deoxy-L-talose 4-dehydrogenase (NAD+)